MSIVIVVPFGKRTVGLRAGSTLIAQYVFPLFIGFSSVQMSISRDISPKNPPSSSYFSVLDNLDIISRQPSFETSNFLGPSSSLPRSRPMKTNRGVGHNFCACFCWDSSPESYKVCANSRMAHFSPKLALGQRKGLSFTFPSFPGDVSILYCTWNSFTMSPSGKHRKRNFVGRDLSLETVNLVVSLFDDNERPSFS